MSSFSIGATLEDMGVNLDAFGDGFKEGLVLQLGHLAASARGEWIRLAQNRLGSSREIYINGLRQAESFKMLKTGSSIAYEIALVGRMPNNFEYGMGPFDMKSVRPGWLGGKASKVGKDGKRYVVIPFRHSTSSSPRFDYTGKAKSVADPDLKTQLRKTAKLYGLDRMVRTSAGQVATGAVKKLPSTAIVHPYLRGLTRYQTASKGVTKAGQRGSGSLMTFRIMSENSKPGSWRHPGIQAFNLLAEVETYIDNQMRQIVNNVIGVGI